MKIFSGFCHPRSGTVLGTPDLDNGGFIRMMSDTPVKAIASHIHQASAVRQEVGDRIKHLS